MDGINIPEHIAHQWGIGAVQRSTGNIMKNKPTLVPIMFWELFNHVEDLKKINTEASKSLVRINYCDEKQKSNIIYELKKISLRLNQILLHLKEMKKFYRENMKEYGDRRTDQEAYSYAHEAEAAGELLLCAVEAKLYQTEELARERKNVEV